MFHRRQMRNQFRIDVTVRTGRIPFVAKMPIRIGMPLAVAGNRKSTFDCENGTSMSYLAGAESAHPKRKVDFPMATEPVFREEVSLMEPEPISGKKIGLQRGYTAVAHEMAAVTFTLAFLCWRQETCVLISKEWC